MLEESLTCSQCARSPRADMKARLVVVVLVVVLAVAVAVAGAAVGEGVSEEPDSAVGSLDIASQNRLWHPYPLFLRTASAPEPGPQPGPEPGPGPEPAPACGLSYSEALALSHRAWDDLLLILGDRVELLPFADTVMQYYKHASLRRTLRPLELVEGTEVSGLRSGEVTLLGVNDTEPAVYFNVKLNPLKIRGALRTGENKHLLRAFLVDMTFRFRTVVDSRDLARLAADAPGRQDGDRGAPKAHKREVAATRYGLARAGHVTHLQVASGDRTETAFGQEVEALLAGAAVTSVWHELQRAASVHINWERERQRPLQWDATQAPRSWVDS